MKCIPLTQGLVALVDNDDYEKLSQYRWCVNKAAVTVMYAVRGHEGKLQYMQNVIIDSPPGLEVDHIDTDGLNNQKKNLRLATRVQQSTNQFARYGTSRFKGVFWNTRRKVWGAQIRSDGKAIHIGQHATEIAAAYAYDEKAREIQGEFGRYNFPRRGERPAVRKRPLDPGMKS